MSYLKLYTYFLFTLFSLSVIAQTETETLKEAKQLIENKKYESAFKLLDKFDPTNDKPNVVLLKEDILLNYFTTSLMHQMFALKDLEPHEDIMDYRGKDGSFGMQVFQVDSLLNRLIKMHPNNCKLYKGLGDYYYDAHLRYSDNWVKSSEEQIQLMKTNFEKTVEGGCADFLSYYVLGYTNLVQEHDKESIPYFLKSIEMNSAHASSHYNLAYAYLFNDDRQNALKYAKNALDLYEDTTYKSDAARMIGQIYSELEDDQNALKYYEEADKIDPNNYYNIKLILYAHIKSNSPKLPETTQYFFDLAPENPTIYNDLEEIYIEYKKEDLLIAYYNSLFSKFKENNTITGNLNFYLARTYLNLGKKATAKDYFNTSKTYFEKAFEEDHPVFNSIKQGLEKCEE
ncbi:tetratricopeptide repeat protein [Seonamhaeicola marinus]|uniref:Tetratricopeptide repeat protein n=1 Tax=Seonamhaeicola marinus TaxID=1912246 RepID=A0A5D0HTR0_9FLAO|nr:tetratricopeptide repeat protein [Seonamhaeicola marinus]TYA74744.1 tetratricopeptide repeat protein [Seonamhaeicola marinus]